MNRLLTALAMLAPAALGQQVATCENGPVANPTSDSMCNFGACTKLGGDWDDQAFCAHDESFCGDGFGYITAEEVTAAGREEDCTCVDILDYPSNVGACMTNGVSSPMVNAEDCEDGQPVCEAGPDGHFLEGDTSAAVQYTACDLPCQDDHGHDVPVDKEAFQGCEFFSTEWGAFAVSPHGRMYPRRAAVDAGTLVMGGYLKSKGEPGDPAFVDVELDFSFCGPFTEADPTCASGTTIHEALTPYDVGGWDQYEVGIVTIDAASGVPQNIFSYGGTGRDGLSGMDAAGGVIVASGEFVGDFTVGETTISNSNGADSGRSELDGFVMSITDAGEAKWLLHWPKSTANSRATSASIDEEGHVWTAGYSCSASDVVLADGKNAPDVCHALFAKLDGATGEPVFAKDFPGLEHFNRVAASGGAAYLSGKMYQSDGVDETVGAACAAESCAVVMRVDADGNVEWARTVEGAKPSGSYTGDIEFDADGLHLYVALDDATPKSAAHVSLDSGSAYATCLDADGKATPEFEVDPSQVVTSCPAGSTFVARDDPNAMAADLANSGVYCSGAAATSCVAKYHAPTGLPVWATTIPNAAGLAVTAGSVFGVGYDSGDFDMVTQPNYGGSHMWLTEIDAETGKGVSVETGGGPFGSSRAYDLVADEAGDLLLVGYTSSYEFTLNDLTGKLSEEDTDREAFALKVATSGAKTKSPCLDDCTNLMETTTVAAGNCYIDNLCYADGDNAAKTNLKQECQVCAAATDPKAWTDGPSVGVDHCWIKDACIPKDDPFTYSPRYSSPIPSDCRYCNPSEMATDWSVKEGFNADPSQNPPNDCELVEAPTPVDAPTPASKEPTAGDASKEPSAVPQPTSQGTPKPTTPKGKSDDATYTTVGSVAGVAAGLAYLAL